MDGASIGQRKRGQIMNDEYLAVMALDMFAKIYCRNKECSHIAFRCKECEFNFDGDQCLLKKFKYYHCPDYKNFGCMGDL